MQHSTLLPECYTTRDLLGSNNFILKISRIRYDAGPMEICPVNREWIHTYLLAPFLQGCALVNRAWKGIEFYSLSQRVLTLGERAISFLTGAALLIPVVNCIVWIAWQTFGFPKELFDSYCPETAGPPPIPPPMQIPPPLPGEERRFEMFSYKEKNDHSTISVDWTLEHFPTLTEVKQRSDAYSSTSFYRPDWTISQFCQPKDGPLDLWWTISEYHYKSKDGTFDLWLNDNQIRARVAEIKEGKRVKCIDKTLDLPSSVTDPVLWIQQPTIGFKNFILSDRTEINFYGVIPKFSAYRTPFLLKGSAKKIKQEEVPGHGKLLKVEIGAAAWWIPGKSTFWFDPITGILRKFIDPGLFGKTTAEFVPAGGEGSFIV